MHRSTCLAQADAVVVDHVASPLTSAVVTHAMVDEAAIHVEGSTTAITADRDDGGRLPVIGHRTVADVAGSFGR